MSRDDYAFPCAGCLCDHCANNLYSSDKMAGEAKIFCYVCEEWYRWVHGENAIEELSEEERFCYNISYFHIVQELFLFRTYHSGGTSTMAKCKQLGVDSSENVEFKFEEEEEGE